MSVNTGRRLLIVDDDAEMCRFVGDLRRPAHYRCSAGGEAGEVDVVIVQTRQQRTAAGLDHGLARERIELADGGDPVSGQTQVAAPAPPDLGIPDQHRAAAM